MMCKDDTTRRSINPKDESAAAAARHAHPGQMLPAGATSQRADAVARGDGGAAQVRVEPIDNWHKDWPLVLRAIDRLGQRAALHVDPHGWLSARQVLLVAFEPESQTVAGHVCFRIAPVADDDGGVIVEAQLDALGVQPGFEHVRVAISSTLRHAAELRAKDLKCRRLVGF